MAEASDHTERMKLTVSERDLEHLAEDLSRWLGGRVGADGPPAISRLARPESGGMSSTSILFDADWRAGGRDEHGSFVARLAPDADAFPVFRDYDLPTQYRVMEGVAAATDVPVPGLCWLETGENPLGAPFFVMRRVDGRVPSDNPPYVFVGWLFDATDDERAHLTHKTLEIIAAIHAIDDPTARFPMLDGPGSGLRRHVDAQKDWYRWALADDGYDIPLIDRGFDWLERHWPADPGPDVLSWGDARPGNIIFDGFDPVAVLDWRWPRSARANSTSPGRSSSTASSRTSPSNSGCRDCPGSCAATRSPSSTAGSPATPRATWTSTWSTRRCGTPW